MERGYVPSYKPLDRSGYEVKALKCQHFILRWLCNHLLKLLVETFIYCYIECFKIKPYKVVYSLRGFNSFHKRTYRVNNSVCIPRGLRYFLFYCNLAGFIEILLIDIECIKFSVLICLSSPWLEKLAKISLFSHRVWKILVDKKRLSVWIKLFWKLKFYWYFANVLYFSLVCIFLCSEVYNRYTTTNKSSSGYNFVFVWCGIERDRWDLGKVKIRHKRKG